MSHLPKGWTEVPLASIADLRLGKMLDRLKNTGTPTRYLRNINVRWGTFDLSDLLQIRVEPSELADLNVVNGDVLVCEGGEPGRCAVWRGGDQGLTFQKALHRVRLTEGLLPELLAWQLRSDALTGRLVPYVSGSTIKHLTGQSLMTYRVKVAPVSEQRRIADKLDAVTARVDACRDRLARVAPLLKRFRQSVLAAATGGTLTADWRGIDGDMPGWPLVRLADVASDFSYGSAAKSARIGSVPVLRMGNILGGALDWDDLVYTDDPAEIAKYALVAGDVLFNRTNSPELVGKSAVFKGERPAIYAGYLIRVRCTSRLLPDFLNFCLGSPAGRAYCWSVKSDGVSQSNINASKLKAFELSLPSAEEQAEIVRRVDTLFAFADRLEARLAKAQAAADRLTPALLAKAFRGELVPQDPADEPAAVLLQRLAASRPAPAAKVRRPRAAAAGA